MFICKQPLLHEGGHGHSHAEHEHMSKELSPEQTLALLTYMLDHNRSHAEELHGVCHSLESQGQTEAAEAVARALHYFDHGNEELEAALAAYRRS